MTRALTTWSTRARSARRPRSQEVAGSIPSGGCRISARLTSAGSPAGHSTVLFLCPLLAGVRSAERRSHAFDTPTSDDAVDGGDRVALGVEAHGARIPTRARLGHWPPGRTFGESALPAPPRLPDGRGTILPVTTRLTWAGSSPSRASPRRRPKPGWTSRAPSKPLPRASGERRALRRRRRYNAAVRARAASGQADSRLLNARDSANYRLRNRGKNGGGHRRARIYRVPADGCQGSVREELEFAAK